MVQEQHSLSILLTRLSCPVGDAKDRGYGLNKNNLLGTELR